MIKYRIFYSDNDWLLKEGGGSKLWRKDKEGRPLWPHREPASLCAQPMKNLNEIVKGISRFIKYCKKLLDDDSMEEY
jgi:hypothetical protein